MKVLHNMLVKTVILWWAYSVHYNWNCFVFSRPVAKLFSVITARQSRILVCDILKVNNLN